MTETTTVSGAPLSSNQLGELGYKIFLDRYALKDGSKRSLARGDTVVVCVDVDSGQREIGQVVEAREGIFTVELRDGSRVERYAEHIDKPLETTPAELQARVARGIAAVEATEELRQEWEANFRWLMEGWKFVPGGRILTAAGTDQNLTFYNCLPPDQEVLTPEGYRPIAELQVGDLVITGKGRARPVTHCFSRHTDEPLYHIRPKELGFDTLRLTGEHPVLALRQEWINGHRSRDGLRLSHEPDWIKARDLREGDYIAVGVDRETERPGRLRVMDFLPEGRSQVVEGRLTGPKLRAQEVAAKLQKHYLEYGGLRWTRIASISTEPYLGMVHDIEVAEDHSFISAGVVVSNCYVLPSPADSRGGIVRTLSQMMEIMSRGGGVGINVSSLRPRHSYVKGVNGRSSGAVSWGALYSFVTGLIEQGGSRRGALMLICDVWHPDVAEFITSKTEMGKITNANISVGITDAFMDAVQGDGDWELVFPDTSHPAYEEEWDGDLGRWRAAGHPVNVYRKVRARELWDGIITSAWASAEPGLFFVDRANHYSNSRYYAPLRCTNPCFVGSMRLATDRGLLTFEELWRDQTEIRVVTDLRAADELQRAAGGSGRHVRMGTSLRRAAPVFKTRQNAQVYRLITEHGFEVTGTPDHRFLTPAGYLQLKDLEPGDLLYLQSGGGVWNQDESLPEISWSAAARAKVNARQRRGDAEPPTRWSREIGQFLGWVTGDGYTYHHHGHAALGLIFGREEAPLLPYLRGLVKQWFGVAGATASRHGATALFYDAVPAAFAHSLGVKPVRAHEKRVPDALWHAPKEAVVGFLQALFTCDGTVNISANKGSCSIRLASSSEQLLKEVQLLLLQCRIVSRLRKRRDEHLQLMPGPDRKPKLYRRRSQYELIIDKENRNTFLSEIGFMSEDKHLKAKKWINDKTRRSNFETFTTRVLKIEPAGYADVYDTTEPVTHSIVANGLVCHQCGEQPLPAWSVCNLGAINLAKFALSDGRVNWEELGKAVRYGVRFLDNVIDATPYFFEENEAQQKSERRVGLGTMGLAELLIRCGVRYGSPESIEFIDRLYRFIAVEAYRASTELAAEKGPFARFEAEPFLQSGFMQGMPEEVREAVRAGGIRNVTLLTQAPTGTTGTMVGTSTGIEPFYFWSYYRQSRLGMHEEKVQVLQEWLDAHGEEEPLPEHFITAMDLSPEEHVRVEAAIQRWVDSSISKTCNVPNHWTVEQVAELYTLIYRLGCKGGTIYRDGSRDEQVLHLKKEGQGPQPAEKTEPALKVRAMPGKRYGVTVSKKTPAGTAHITMNDDQEGRPFEVFLEIGKGGSDIKAMAEALGRMMSLVLRLASPLTPRERIYEMINQLEGIGGARSTGFGPNRVRSLPDAVAQALAEHYGNGNGSGQPVRAEPSAQVKAPERMAAPAGVEADLCPSCGNSTLLRQEGCHSCYACGFSEC